MLWLGGVEKGGEDKVEHPDIGGKVMVELRETSVILSVTESIRETALGRQNHAWWHCKGMQ